MSDRLINKAGEIRLETERQEDIRERVANISHVEHDRLKHLQGRGIFISYISLFIK